jgi:NADH-quinone oxidoreductase subunit J
MPQLLFFIAGVTAIAGAVGTVTSRSAFHSVLWLVVHLVALAVLFLLLQAEFLAAAQLIVYAGAVMVLYVFVVSYVGGQDAEAVYSPGATLRIVAPVVAFLVLIELMWAFLGSGVAGIATRGPGVDAAFGSPAMIGELLLNQYMLVFELASLILTIAAVGAVILSRRRRGLESEEEPGRKRLDVVVPEGTGTMAEAAGDRGGPGTLVEPAGGLGAGDRSGSGGVRPAGAPTGGGW